MSPGVEGDYSFKAARHQPHPDHAGASARASNEEAAAIIRRIGAAPGPARVKVMLGRAADALGWPVSRVKHIWYRTAHRITAGEIDALRSHPLANTSDENKNVALQRQGSHVSGRRA